MWVFFRGHAVLCRTRLCLLTMSPPRTAPLRELSSVGSWAPLPFCWLSSHGATDWRRLFMAAAAAAAEPGAKDARRPLILNCGQ